MGSQIQTKNIMGMMKNRGTGMTDLLMISGQFQIQCSNKLIAYFLKRTNKLTKMYWN